MAKKVCMGGALSPLPEEDLTVTSDRNRLSFYPYLLLATCSHHFLHFPGAWQTSTELEKETKSAENNFCIE